MRHRRHPRRALSAAAGIIATVLALASCSAAAPVSIDLPSETEAALPADTAAQLKSAVEFAMAATGSPGAIVGVWAPWSGSWVTGLGTQDVGAGAQVTTGMQFRVAQVTRAMTCDVLDALEADHTVSADDPVTDYVSGVADLDHITLGELCDGTSGIGSYSGQLLSTWLSNPTRDWDPRELASYGLGEKRGDPVTTYRDSDAGYLVLGIALERATGKSAAQLYSEYVFDPLDLTSTTYEGDGEAGGGPELHGHYSVRDAAGAMGCAAPLDVTDLSPTTGATDSGVLSDIDDLGRYIRSVAGDALTPQNEDRLAGALPAYAGAPSWFTVGGGVYQAGSLIGQYGSVPGYTVAAYADPKTGLTVAVVLNNSAAGASSANSLAWELAAIASKAPAAAGKTAPEAGLPWTAQQYHDAIAAAAICPLPAS